jgi:hypothetical protein
MWPAKTVASAFERSRPAWLKGPLSERRVTHPAQQFPSSLFGGMKLQRDLGLYR